MYVTTSFFNLEKLYSDDLTIVLFYINDDSLKRLKTGLPTHSSYLDFFGLLRIFVIYDKLQFPGQSAQFKFLRSF